MPRYAPPNDGEVSLLIEVGYSSLGHFSKAFCEATGCCPSLHPPAEHLINSGF